MTGKDLKEGMVLGDKRVREIIKRGRWILFSYDYLVSEDDGTTRWYRQAIPPVARIAANKRIS